MFKVFFILTMVHFCLLFAGEKFTNFDQLMLSNKEEILKNIESCNINDKDSIVILILQHDQKIIDSLEVLNNLFFRKNQFSALSILFYKKNDTAFFKIITDTVVYKSGYVKNFDPFIFNGYNKVKFTENEIKNDFPIGVFDNYSGIVFKSKNIINYFKFNPDDDSQMNKLRMELIENIVVFVRSNADNLNVDYFYNPDY